VAARILKADQIVVNLCGTVPSTAGGHTDRHTGSDEDAESQAVMAEAKLSICKLLNDAKQQAGTIISEAREQAQQLLEQAAAEQEQVRETARQAGYEAGQSALQAEREQLNEERMAQQAAIEQERSRLMGEMEPAIIELSLQIARKIIHDELQLAPEQAVGIARAVLAQVVDADSVSLRVSADDYTAVTDALTDKSGGRPKVRFRVDHELKSGDCLAITPHGTVDGTIEGQMTEIRQRLAEVAENG
jgi:flagellar assembly protein FliH